MTEIKVNYLHELILILIKKEMHGRQIAKELRTSLARVQAILTELRKANALDYKIRGKNHVYFFKKNMVSRSFVLNAENYKLAKILSRHNWLEPIFQDLIKKRGIRMIILFGSYAKGTEKKGSDIDLYVQTTNQKTKREIQNVSDLISVKTGRFNTDDLLIKEIIKNHTIIKGAEEYYEKIKFFE